MWIRNKATGSIQEIHNADVIQLCRNEPETYGVDEQYREGNEEAEGDLAIGSEQEPSEAESEPDSVEKGEDEEVMDYSLMKINDLRKVAKEKGIQGYTNMDKATLAAVIQMH